MSAESTYISVDIPDNYAIITIDRPPVNAMSASLIAQLHSAVRELAENRQVNAVLIQSAAEHFSAGADLRERAGVKIEAVLDAVSAIQDCFTAVSELPVPVVAAVNGAAVGGGAELALACDIRVMADNVRFGFPEVGLGIIPGAGGTQRLPQLIGASLATELICTGRIIDAVQCRQIGITNRIVGVSGLHKEALRLVRELARQAPLAVRAALKAIREGKSLPIADGLRLERSLYDQMIRTSDRQEGLTARLEERAPEWRGE